MQLGGVQMIPARSVRALNNGVVLESCYAKREGCYEKSKRGSRRSAALATAAVAHLAGASLAQADGYQTRGKVAFERPLDWSGLYFGIHSGWAWSQTDAFFPGGIPPRRLSAWPARASALATMPRS